MGSGGERIDLTTVKLWVELLRCVPRHLAWRYRALPVFESSDCLVIATAGSPELDVVDTLAHVLQHELEFRSADEGQLDKFLRTLYVGAGAGDR
jgi:hypothetical protein